jgi:hypothetical protein
MEHSNLGVRRLLRKLRYPGLLERDHYAATLRDIARSASARDALLALIHDALRGYPSEYWTIIKRIDADGEAAKAVADALYLSYRTLHRYRSAAIEAIAEVLERRLGPERTAIPRADGDADAHLHALIRARSYAAAAELASLLAEGSRAG